MANSLGDAIREAREYTEHRERMRCADFIRRIADKLAYGSESRIVINAIAADIEEGRHTRLSEKNGSEEG